MTPKIRALEIQLRSPQDAAKIIGDLAGLIFILSETLGAADTALAKAQAAITKGGVQPAQLDELVQEISTSCGKNQKLLTDIDRRVQNIALGKGDPAVKPALADQLTQEDLIKAAFAHIGSLRDGGHC